MFYWVLAALSVTGTILNIKKNHWCFVIWGVTNLFWGVVGMVAAQKDPRMYAQAAMFFFYFILACYGWIVWRKTIKEEKRIKTLEESWK
ncbi:MAG: nicotinamide mononucleotide transporter [Candidatus Omnitrophota bacterium]